MVLGLALGLVLTVAGCGPGLLLWPCGTLHLGCGDFGCRSELHHDRDILWAVCDGGQWKREADALPSVVTQPVFVSSGAVAVTCPSCLYCAHL